MNELYKIKPLKWAEKSRDSGIARSVIGDFFVYYNYVTGDWRYVYRLFEGECPTVEEAKTRCEKLYLKRMKRGLVEVE